jgi:hypothetical protein
MARGINKVILVGTHLSLARGRADAYDSNTESVD